MFILVIICQYFIIKYTNQYLKKIFKDYSRYSFKFSSSIIYIILKILEVIKLIVIFKIIFY